MKVWINVWAGAQIGSRGPFSDGDLPRVSVSAEATLGVHIFEKEEQAQRSRKASGGVVLQIEAEQLKAMFPQNDFLSYPALSSLNRNARDAEFYSLTTDSAMHVFANGGEKYDADGQCEGWVAADEATGKWLDDLRNVLGIDSFLI